MRELKWALTAALLWTAPVYAGTDGSWTNKAGHVLSATPVALKGAQVLFTNTTQSLSYPLSAFMPAEQNRLKAALGVVEIPQELRAAHAYAQRTLKRLRVLHENGKITDEEYASQSAAVRQLFRNQATPFKKKGLISE